MYNSSTYCYPFHADLISIIAKDIVKNHHAQWPFLQDVIVLLPNYRRAADLQQAILREYQNDASPTAMLGPQIYSLKDYITRTTTLDQAVIPHDARELILIEALQTHRDLFSGQNHLTTAYALLELFDELTREQVSLPDSLEQFISQLQDAYQCKNQQQLAISKEAQIVHRLWFAWHQQLEADNTLDKESCYQLKLAKNLKSASTSCFYIAGFNAFLAAEIQWINFRLEHNSTRLYFQTPAKPDEHFQKLRHAFSCPEVALHHATKNNRSQFLALVFDAQPENLRQRAQQANKMLKTVNDAINTFFAKSFEEEAQAITLQIRLWLKQGKHKLALILEDRRLARRIRALLQRNGIGMIDESGWALSTTTAASVIESWLQCIEENFHHIPLLDVLKSPFAFEQSEEHRQIVHQFEQDIVNREKISRDLMRYRKAWHSRQRRLGIPHTSNSNKLPDLIDRLSHAAAPLKVLLQKPQASLGDYLQALKSALVQLNTWELLQTDAAGKEILNLLNKLAQAATHTNSQWDWLSFRHWLGVKLEENYFSPCNQFEHAVELLHLSQTALRKFDGVIIGNMIREQFPGTIKQTPFFNQSVRQELGLKALVNQRHIKYYYFRQLIESAPLILLSYHSGPQESLLSPWLELLSRFHQLAFDQSLESQILHQLMQRQTANNSPRNDTKKRNPPPTITSAMLPGSLSASAHQTLIQCPYAFFASQILKLRATEEISEKLAKSDYGERVHLCLQAFHAGGIKQVDGPFPNTIHSANKKQAIDMLSNIAKQVFANDLEDNFQHRGWLKRWLEIIPSYIDWQIQHETNWRFKNGEIKTTSQLTENLKLHGRIDRIDQSSEELNIIDYKTGSTPATQQVENGEAIQLTHYALSSPENVSRVGYLQFGGSKADIAEKCVLEDETLTNLKEQARIRLIKIYQALANGAELPAWGEEKVCQYCQFDGLCRHKLQ